MRSLKVSISHKEKKNKSSKQESEQFWSNIWDNEKEHQRNAEWLRELTAEKDNMTQNINITTKMIKEQVKRSLAGKAQNQREFRVTH